MIWNRHCRWVVLAASAVVALSALGAGRASGQAATTSPARAETSPAAPAAAPVAGLSGPVHTDFLTWTSMPPLPDAEGFAGMYAGVLEGHVVAAGGANFPNGYPWQGGKKAWYDHVFVLSGSANPQAQPRWEAGPRLPRPLAYGVSASWRGADNREMIILAGGETAPEPGQERALPRAEVYALERTARGLELAPLPPLPAAAAHACGMIVGSTLYLAGGQGRDGLAMKTFWAMDLARPRTEWTWVDLPPWPGPARMQAVAGSLGGEFYLLGGVGLEAEGEGKVRRIEPYCRDAYAYAPPKAGQPGRWRRLADMPAARAAAPSPALSAGPSHLALLGGTDETLQHQDFATHGGFPRSALLYHSITDTWRVVERAVPEGLPRVTAPTVAHGGGLLIVSGERSPGRRSPQVVLACPRPQRASFGWLNALSLGLYLASMVLLGVWFARRNKTTDDFFRGGQSIPWWAAGLSIFATMLSSITYMAIPGYAFASGWTNFLNNAYLVITPLVVLVYLPFYRRLNVTSAYEYLEHRFNLACRLLGSLLFMLFQAGRIAVVLYLPSLALATVTDLDVTLCVIIMGLVSVLYTGMGGISAVIWTDVVQSLVLLGGAVLALGVIAFQVEGGLIGIFQTAHADAKLFQQVNWSWSWDSAVATAWIIILGSIFSNLLPYTASQDVVQRYVTTKDQRSAARAIWTNAAIALPGNALFFVIGSALYAFYKAHPARLEPTMANDAVFPLFIIREMPAGLAGLIIAGIFAAAQSTISSSLNSVATCYVTDFHRRLGRPRDDRYFLGVARWATALIGLAGTGAALWVAGTSVRSLWETFMEVLSLFGGALAGLFALGIFSRRASGGGALAGVLASAAVVCWLKFGARAHFFTFAPAGLAVVMLVGYLASLLLPRPPKDLRGLTIYTMNSNHGGASRAGSPAAAPPPARENPPR